MKNTYDAIVIGAGHNGLTTACYLAKAGLTVLVLEAYHSIGGMTITEEVTLPGFYSDIHASGYQLANFSPVVSELTLEKFGLEIIKPELAFSHAYPNGKIITVHRDIEKTEKSISQFSKKDALTWRTLSDNYLKERNNLIHSFFSPPLSFSDQALKIEKTVTGFDQYRFSMQSVRSWCNEIFEADETHSLFGSFASFLGASPDDAGGAELACLFASVLQNEGNNIVKGGMHNLSNALAKYLLSKGGEIRTNTKVTKIIGNKNKATGVILENGEQITASQLIVSNIDPQQLILKLLGKELIDERIIKRIQHYEWGDSVFVIYAALDGPIHYKSGDLADLSPHVHLSSHSLSALDKIYFECRGGYLPSAPLIVSWNDSVIDPSRAPKGKRTIKFVVLNVPYQIKGDATGKIKGSDWNQVKEVYADYLIDMINENYIPNLKENILKRVVHSPLDLEQKITTAVKGTLGQGAYLPYQNGCMRPLPEFGEYKTPINNVYVCGSSSYPGPGVSMAPGRNAAQIICRDLDIEFEKLINL